MSQPWVKWIEKSASTPSWHSKRHSHIISNSLLILILRNVWWLWQSSFPDIKAMFWILYRWYIARNFVLLLISISISHILIILIPGDVWWLWQSSFPNIKVIFWILYRWYIANYSVLLLISISISHINYHKKW